MKIQKDGLDIELIENFIEPELSLEYLKDLEENSSWEQGYFKNSRTKKEYPFKRLQSFSGDVSYYYSGTLYIPTPWEKAPESLLKIRSLVEDFTQVSFNGVLSQKYVNGLDYMGYHSDDEKEIVKGSTIASVSFGVTRKFYFKSKDKTNKEVIKVNLSSGSLLLMNGQTQKYWKHSLPEDKKCTGLRINLTFRVMVNK